MARRSKLELYVNILEEIGNGTTLPTRIMYGVNTSWKPFQSMLKSLIDQELVEECEVEGDDRSRKMYRLCDKGRNVLIYFGKAKVLLEEEKHLEMRNWR